MQNEFSDENFNISYVKLEKIPPEKIKKEKNHGATNGSSNRKSDEKKSQSTQPKKKNMTKTKKKVDGKNDHAELWFEPERIVGATDLYGDKITFHIKVKDRDDYEIVSSKIANLACPQLVIAFYQKHLVFTD
ncbi:chromobox protein homolog 5-like [Contarinia nasturtii]|uniref:chromobox protein homolog 5-like n=1 Tax=Contarinia nasturtii TaxID=265458 RepID=UPI0012D3CE74|nr:chromobox protein homolog 5-like [Contarinia nasturtii]